MGLQRIKLYRYWGYVVDTAVTGHTSGIGRGLFEYFQTTGNARGFSRSNGHNIGTVEGRQRIVDSAADCDIFVNNAYSNFDRSQYLLLESIFQCWADKPDRLIINISSRWTTDKHPYCTTKLEQDDFCIRNMWMTPRIINLKPGWVDTPRVADVQKTKMPVQDLVNVVDKLLRNRDNFPVYSITFGF